MKNPRSGSNGIGGSSQGVRMAWGVEVVEVEYFIVGQKIPEACNTIWHDKAPKQESWLWNQEVRLAKVS